MFKWLVSADMMDRVVCLYGSVTGKAMSIAEQVVELGHSKGMEVG